jgi:hypothetical protein
MADILTVKYRSFNAYVELLKGLRRENQERKRY